MCQSIQQPDLGRDASGQLFLVAYVKMCQTSQLADFCRDGPLIVTPIQGNTCSSIRTVAQRPLIAHFAFDKGEGGRKKKNYLSSEFHRRSTE